MNEHFIEDVDGRRGRRRPTWRLVRSGGSGRRGGEAANDDLDDRPDPEEKLAE
jgi:hypothetical protein